MQRGAGLGTKCYLPVGKLRSRVWSQTHSQAMHGQSRTIFPSVIPQGAGLKSSLLRDDLVLLWIIDDLLLGLLHHIQNQGLPILHSKNFVIVSREHGLCLS